MSEAEQFREMMELVRRGDAAAAAQLVQSYERELKILARVRLNDPRLRRLVDSMDVCQSVLGNFFVRVSTGQIEVDTPENLLALLSKMVGNKVIDLARNHQAARRDLRRIDRIPSDEFPFPDKQDTPSQIASAKELAQAVRDRLTPTERALVDAHLTGRSWDEIARQFGRSAEALRKETGRAIDRVAKQLGISEVNDA